MRRRLLAVVAMGVVACPLPQTASAQLGGAVGGSKNNTPIDRNQPVAFTADNFEYDRDTGIVTASGHVEAWQNDHVLRADKITFDRNTNVAAASGNVVLVEACAKAC
jgi:LPS-assembly protein